MPVLNLTDDQYNLLVGALSQVDYAAFHGDQECLAAAVVNCRKCLDFLDVVNAEHEQLKEVLLDQLWDFDQEVA